MSTWRVSVAGSCIFWRAAGMAGALAGLVKEYGRLAVGVHVVSSTGFYGLAVVGVRYGADLPALLAALPLPQLPPSLLDATAAPGASLAAEATAGYVVYKAASPVRWPVTIGVTTALARYTDLR